MVQEKSGLGLVILGIVAIVGVISLVLLFSGAKNTGAFATYTKSVCTPAVGERERAQFESAGFDCASLKDDYGNPCCVAPSNVPVRQRSLGVPVEKYYPELPVQGTS